MAMINGCATIKENLNNLETKFLSKEEKTEINPNLPSVETLKSISDITEIGFEWNAIKDETVAGFYLYRSDSNGRNEKLIGIIDDRFSTHYVDTNLEPNTEYRYRIRTYNDAGISSDAPEIYAKTDEILNSVDFARVIYGLPDRIKIIWVPHSDKRVRAYIIQRHKIGTNSWDKIARLQGRLNAEYIDKKLSRGAKYEYRILVEIANGVISKPSQIILAQ